MVSTNKVDSFQQYLFNYDTNTNQLFQYSKTDIAFIRQTLPVHHH